MPKPNYAFERRQRELEKKRKKEEKAAERAARKVEPRAGDEPGGEPAATDEGGTAERAEPPASAAGTV